MRKGRWTLAAAAGAAAFALRRRARAGSRERVEIYLEDGSMVALPGSLPEARRLVGLARDVLAAARS